MTRDERYVATSITADGRDGYPVEAGRYRLVVSRACPWANRAVIVRRLLGLEDPISMGICGPTHDRRSWTFDLDPGGVDPVLGIERIQDAYLARFDAVHHGHFTCNRSTLTEMPVLWAYARDLFQTPGFGGRPFGGGTPPGPVRPGEDVPLGHSAASTVG